MNYDNFKTLAFTQYGIPGEILEVVRPWIERELSGRGFHSVADGLGYAELSDIQNIDDAMAQLKELIWMASLAGTSKKTAELREQFLKDAGGRIGKGFYRYALKAYYLTLADSK